MTESLPTIMEKKKLELSVRLIAWVVRFLFWLTIGAAVFMAASVLFLLLFANNLSYEHAFTKDFLVNVAAGCAEIAVGTSFAAIIGWAIAKNKLREISRPVLALIQRLRIDSKLTPEAARRSVVCAVAVISEANVSKAISAGSSGPTTDCPICAQEVEQEMDRCLHCQLPKTIWRDDELLKVHIANPTST